MKKISLFMVFIFVIGIFVGCSEKQTQSYKDAHGIYQQLTDKREIIKDNSKGNWQMGSVEISKIENMLLSYTEENLTEKEDEILSNITEAMNYYLKAMISHEKGDGLEFLQNVKQLDVALKQLDKHFKK